MKRFPSRCATITKMWLVSDELSGGSHSPHIANRSIYIRNQRIQRFTYLLLPNFNRTIEEAGIVCGRYGREGTDDTVRKMTGRDGNIVLSVTA
jgi:hypothetical protein